MAFLEDGARPGAEIGLAPARARGLYPQRG
jgi:hypothetical protein